MFERVVCGVDGSAESLEAVRQADVVLAAGGRLVLVSAVDLSDTIHFQIAPTAIHAARRALEGDSRVTSVTAVGDALRVEVDEGDVPEINLSLVEAGIAVHELHWERPSLEDVFLELTRDDAKGGAA